MAEIRMHEILASFPLSSDEYAAMDEDARAAWDAKADQREDIHRMVVFGHDSKVDRKTGQPIPQGIGAPGRENMNHFQSVRRYEGEEAYWQEVARVWKQTPKHAEKLHKLGLPKPRKEVA